jgi:hypothetical protein
MASVRRSTRSGFQRQVQRVKMASTAETNCPSYPPDKTTFSSILAKRTGGSNLMSHQDLILKILKRFIRSQEPSAIGGQRSAKAKTNCPTHVFESKLLTSFLVKRTARPKPMKAMEMILKILKRFIRCQQQIQSTAVLHGPGILTDPKASNHRIFNMLDPFFGLRIAGFEGGEPKPSKRNFFNYMLQKTAASWNKSKHPINELDPGHGLGNRAGVERTAGTLNSAWPCARPGKRKTAKEIMKTKPKSHRKQGI